MKEYTVENASGKQITFQWEDDVNPPTDNDFQQIFDEAEKFKAPEPYQPKPGDIPINMPKPIEPGPYGEDIARFEEMKRANPDILKQKQDFTKPPMAGAINLAGFAAEQVTKIPKWFKGFEDKGYDDQLKRLDEWEKKGVNPEFIAAQRERIQKQKGQLQTIGEKAVKPVVQAVEPLTKAVKQKTLEWSETISPIADEAEALREELKDIGPGKDKFIDDMVDSYKKGTLDTKLNWFGTQALLRGDKEAADLSKQLAEEYRQAQLEDWQIQQQDPNFVGPIKPKTPGKFREITRSVARMAPGLVASAAASAVPIIGAPATFLGWASQGAGQVYQDAVAQGADPEKARVSAAIAGPVYAFVEQAQIGKIVKMPELKKGIIKALADYGIDVAKEVNEEGLQGIVTTIATEKAKGNEDVNDIAKKAWESYLENAKQSIASLAVVTGATRGARAVLTPRTPTTVAERPGIDITVGGQDAEGNGRTPQEASGQEGTQGGPEGGIYLRDNAGTDLLAAGQKALEGISPEEQGAIFRKAQEKKRLDTFVENLTPEQAQEIITKAKLPNIDLSKITDEDRQKVAESADRILKQQKPTGTGSIYDMAQPAPADEEVGKTIAARHGLNFVNATEGPRDQGGVVLNFQDEITGKTISAPAGTAESEIVKTLADTRRENPQEYGNKIGEKAGVEFVGKREDISKSLGGIGKYETVMNATFKTPLGNEFTVPFSSTVDEIKSAAAELDKRVGAKNVPEKVQAPAEVKPPEPVKPPEIPVNRDTERMLKMYLKTGKAETSLAKDAETNLLNALSQVTPAEVARTIEIDEAQAAQGIKDIQEKNNTEAAKKIRESIGVPLFWGQPVEEAVQGIKAKKYPEPTEEDLFGPAKQPAPQAPAPAATPTLDTKGFKVDDRVTFKGKSATIYGFEKSNFTDQVFARILFDVGGKKPFSVVQLNQLRKVPPVATPMKETAITPTKAGLVGTEKKETPLTDETAKKAYYDGAQVEPTATSGIANNGHGQIAHLQSDGKIKVFGYGNVHWKPSDWKISTEKKADVPGDLVIGPLNNQTVYKAEEVDQDEYDHIKMLASKAEIEINKTKELLATRPIDKDTKAIRQSLEANEKFVKNWETKIKPWMENILGKKANVPGEQTVAPEQPKAGAQPAVTPAVLDIESLRKEFHAAVKAEVLKERNGIAKEMVRNNSKNSAIIGITSIIKEKIGERTVEMVQTPTISEEVKVFLNDELAGKKYETYVDNFADEVYNELYNEIKAENKKETSPLIEAAKKSPNVIIGKIAQPEVEPKKELTEDEKIRKAFEEKQAKRAAAAGAKPGQKIEEIKQSQKDELDKAKDALERLGKSFLEQDPNTFYMAGTRQAELAYEAVTHLVKAGYHKFREVVEQIKALTKDYLKIKGFREAIEDAYDAHQEFKDYLEKRTETIDQIIGTEETPKPTEKPAEKPKEKPAEQPAQTDLFGQPEETPKKPEETPKERLINSLVDRLKHDAPIKTTRELLDFADKAYGGTLAEGKYGIRDAYDALEAAFNKHLESFDLSPNAKDTIKFYNEEMQKLPTQTVRTEGQVELQQFSTPPSEAFLVAKLGGIKKDMRVLEPSAGDGSIAVQARMQGGTVAVNEIDKGRQENLEILGFTPYDVDAEYLHSTLPDKVVPDVVVMNPPFSATGGRLKGHNTAFGAEHVYQALLRLKPGGRLVAIVGNGMAFGKPKMAGWWAKIMKDFNVRANIGISGKEYVKYGTGFDNNILVIDKTGPTERQDGKPVNVIGGEGFTVEQAYDRLKPLTEEDVYGNIQKANAGKGPEVVQGPKEGTGGQKPAIGNDNKNLVGRRGGTDTDQRTGTDRAAVDRVDKPGSNGPRTSGTGGLSAPDGSGETVTSTTRKRPGTRNVVPAPGSVGQPGRESNINGPLTDKQIDDLYYEHYYQNNWIFVEENTSSGKFFHYDKEEGRKSIVKGKKFPTKAEAFDWLLKNFPVAGIKQTTIEEPKKPEELKIGSAEKKAIEEESGGVYAKYRVRKAVYQGSKEHPAKVSESVAMASVEPPEVTRKLHLPQRLIESGAISDVQLEAITYANQAHEQRLPTGQRKEFLLGDGTGMGKARTLIGIIYENWLQGKKKTVYITKAADLVNQFKADMDAMGIKIPVIELGDIKQNEDIPGTEGVLFATYGTASSEFNSADRKRYKQILKWFGKDNDGVFIFDESHLMKNVSESQFTIGGETKSLQEGTARGQMGVAFKKDLPNARFVNASATAATTPINLAYLSRLGLWGQGAPFADFMDFLNVMKDGGTGSMELLSRDLKSNGLYLSRSISFDGVEYETVTHNLNESETKTYNDMADFWAHILEKIDKAAENSHMRNEKTRIMKQFYSSQQRFFLQLMMSFQAESMLKDADAQLKEGNSVVISLYNTNESQTNRKISESIANGDDLDAIEFSPKDGMKTLLETHFPLIQYEEYTDQNGNKGVRPVLDKNGEPLINKQNKDIQNSLIEKLAELRIPENPIDRIVNYFGADNIAEITGRKKRLVVNAQGHREYKERGSKNVPQKRINQHEREQFMQGKKRIAIISGAAATGFDLHSSLKSKNQQRRAFYAMQLSWSADEQMQAFGRVHRTQQASEPIIKLMKTNIASQMRLVNTIQSRLASLGAMTKGGREALSGGIFTAEDITDQYGESALYTVYQDTPNSILKRMNILDKDGNIKSTASSNVDGFLNRIMVLPIKEQNEIFEKFYKEYQANVQEARNRGTYDEGIQKIKGRNVRITNEELLNKDETSGVETKLVSIESEVSVEKYTYQHYLDTLSDTFPVIQSQSKRGYLAKKWDDDSYSVYGPRGFHGNYSKAGYFGKFQREREEVVRANWKEVYDKIPNEETIKTTLVTGSIFPVYRKVFLENDHSSKKVQRAVLENGDSVIGIQVKNASIPKIKQNFGIGSDIYNLKGKEILDLINADSIIELDNGWTISKRRVMGEQRIEVDVGRTLPTPLELSNSGMFGEIIQYTKRYFIPTDPKKAEAAIDSIIRFHKAVRDRSAGPAMSKGRAPGSMTLDALKEKVQGELPRVLRMLPKDFKGKVNVSISPEFTYKGRKFGGDDWEAAVWYDPAGKVVEVHINPNISEKRLAMALMHELPGHIGSRLVYADNMPVYNRMKAFFDKMNAENHPSVTIIKRDYEAELRNDVNNEKLFDEWTAAQLAEYIENGKRDSITTRIYNFFRELLTKLGVLPKNLNDTMREMIKLMRKGTYETLGGNKPFQRFLYDTAGQRVEDNPSQEQKDENYQYARKNTADFGKKPRTLTKKARKELKEAGYYVPETDQEPIVFDFRSNFQKWFEGSKVVDENGDPLVVYRGEHGETDQQIQSRLGSISFGSESAAKTYSEYPNDRQKDSYAKNPRIHKVYLSIKNPFIEADDPFIDFSYIQEKLGKESAIKYAKLAAAHIENTNNWEENYAQDYSSVADLLDKKPSEVKNLYVDAYVLFDDKDFTKEVKDAGYDGGIFEGVGENSGEKEYHVFDLNQIKSVDNTGSWSPDNPDIRFSKLPKTVAEENAIRQEELDRMRGYSVYDRRGRIKKVTEEDLPGIYEQAKTFDPEKARKIISRQYKANQTGVNLAKYLGRTLSGRFLEISPIIRDKLQKHINKISIDNANYMRRVLPLLEAVKALPEADYRVFDIASKNSDIAEMMSIAEKHNFVEALDEYRNVMNDLIARANAAGYETGYLENYFPRIPLDRNQYYKFIRGTPEWGQIEEALKQKAIDVGRTLEPEEQDEFINQYLRGYSGKNVLGKPGNLKERKMKFIDNEMNSLLEDTILAIPMYIDRLNKKIARKELFGNVNTSDDMIVDTLDESIGEYVGNLIRDYKLNPEKQDELVGLLKSYFNFKPTDRTLAAIKNLSYATSMGSGFSSMFSQMQDMTFSFVTAPGNTAGAVLKALQRKTDITVKDLGIEDLGAEFRDPGKLFAAVDKLLRFVGLKWGDITFKNAFIQANLQKFQKMARTGNYTPQFKNELNNIFEEKSDELIADLKAGRNSDLVKLLVMNEMSKYQPITQFQVPQGYLDMPRGRIAYALKTYQINQVNAIIDEGIRAMQNAKDGDEWKAAFLRVVSIMAVLMIAGMGMDALKDLLFRRMATMGEYAWDNLLKLFAISRYTTWQARTKGLYPTLLSLVAPPLNWIEYGWRDINKITRNPEDFKLKNLESLRMLPIIGQEYYWWFGGGAEQTRKRAEKNLPPVKFEREMRKLKAEARRAARRGDDFEAAKKEHEMKVLAEKSKPIIDEYFKKEKEKTYPKKFQMIMEFENSKVPKLKYKGEQMIKDLNVGEEALYQQFKNKNREKR